VAEDEMPRVELFAADMREDDEFAQTVAALAASLPSLAEAAEPVDDPSQLPDSSIESASCAQTVVPPPPGADDTSAPERDAAPAEFDIAAEEIVVESAIAVFVSEPSPPPAPAPEQLAIDHSAHHGSSSSESEAALGEASPAAAPLAFAGEGREEPASGAETDNEILSELPPDAGVPNPLPASAPLPAPQLLHDGETALAADAVTHAGDEQPAAEQAAAPGESVDARREGPPPAALVIAEPAEQELVDCAVECEPQNHPAGEADRQGFGAIDRVTVHADEIGERLGAEPSRALLPEPQPLAGPDEDPGDLFEPVADAPLPAPIEPAVTAPAPSSPPATQPELPAVLSGANAVELADDPRAVASGSEGTGVTDATTPVAAPPAPAGVSEQDGKPLPEPASAPPAPSQSPPRRVPAAAPAPIISRPASNDPLAPVRALSDEEMIALFS